MRSRQNFFFFALFPIIVFCVFVGCSDDSLGENQTGKLEKTVEDLKKELKELGAKQVEVQLNILARLGEEEKRINSNIQNLIGEEKKENENVHDILNILKKPKEELTIQEKAIVKSEAPLKIARLEEKRNSLMTELFKDHYSGLLYYMKIDQKSTITSDQDLAARSVLKETISKQLDGIRKEPVCLRSAEAYLDKYYSLTEATEVMRLNYYYKTGVALTTPCLGIPNGAVITNDQYKNALTLFESHRSAIMCYLNILHLTITQVKLENGLHEQSK